jgi:D-alanyl-D-alanine carboxypeptidase
MTKQSLNTQLRNGDLSRRDVVFGAALSLVALPASFNPLQEAVAKAGDSLLGAGLTVPKLPLRSRTLLETRLTQIVERFVQTDPCISGTLVHVDTPALGDPVAAAAGFSNPAAGVPLQAIDQFCCASICKMYTTACVMRLVEKGSLRLDDRIAQHLPAQLLQGLAVYKGTDYSSKITLRQCLGHTSGLWDYYEDGGRNDKDYTPFDLLFLRDPGRFWTPIDVIEWGKRNLEVVASPGTLPHYSDTNYLLIGLVMESVTNKPFYSLMRELVLDPLKMEGTYAQYREEKRQPPGVKLLHWFDSRMRRDQDDPQLGVDLSQENWESSDYGGGGWLTTAGDLVKFLRGASGNTLFKDPNSWQLMQAWSDDSWTYGGCKYGLGLMRFPLPGGGALVGHVGYYGSFAFLWPERDVAMIGTFNQGTPCSPAGDTSIWHLLRKVYSAVAEVLVP